MKPQTRAQAAGVSVARLRSQANKFAAVVRDKAGQIGHAWQDVDNTIPGATEELLAALERWEQEVKEGLEFISEVPE